MVPFVAQSAYADILFNITPSNSTVSQGSTGTLSFGVTATGADVSQTIDSYRIGFTPSVFGGASLADLTFSPPAAIAASNLSSGFTANTGATGTDPGSYFVFASLDQNQAPQALGSELSFFQIDYTVSGSATELGGFNFDIKNIADGNPGANVQIALSGNQITTNSVDGIEATLTFAAVPEPSSLAILLGIAGFVGMRRRKN